MVERKGLRRLPAGAWLKLGAIGLGGAALLAVAPQMAETGTRPPVALLLLVGFLLIAAAGAAVYGAVRSDLGLPGMVAWYAVGYNALLILVKFVFGPFGLYEVNQSVDFEAIGLITNPAGAAMAATTVLILYLAGYLIVYRIATKADRPSWIARLRDRAVRNRRAVLLVVGGALLVAAAGGTGLLLVMLIFASSGLEYIHFVFSSSASLLVATFLASATILLGLHVREAASLGRAGGLPGGVPRHEVTSEIPAPEQLVANAAAVAAVFWLGLCFIALYHILWVVYILVLTSIWPLRTVVPK
ncbi:MAG: hypothetical protein ABR505_01010 [Actinomycetota bacterium]